MLSEQGGTGQNTVERPTIERYTIERHTIERKIIEYKTIEYCNEVIHYEREYNRGGRT